jgi:hypothetical protein
MRMAARYPAIALPAASSPAWYSHYPALTVALKETIPFHASMVAPTAPTITSGPTNCADASAANTSLAVAGRHTHLTSSFAGDLSITASNTLLTADAGVVVTGSVTIGTTATIGNVEIDGKGGSSRSSDYAFADRLQFTADTTGSVLQSGGTRLYSDVVVKWCKVKNSSATTGAAFTVKWKNSAILGCCVRAPGWGVITSYQATNAPLSSLLLLGNSILTEHTTTNGAGMRLGNGAGLIDDVRVLVMHGNHVRTTGGTFQGLRLNSIQDFYAFYNVWRGAGTAGAVHFGNLAGDVLGNVYVNDNQYYDCSTSSLQYGVGTGPDLLEWKNNTCYGGFTEANWDTAIASPDVGDTIVDTGSVWNATTTHPAWPSAGDPTSL